MTVGVVAAAVVTTMAVVQHDVPEILLEIPTFSGIKPPRNKRASV